jgi:hypothetical protein
VSRYDSVTYRFVPGEELVGLVLSDAEAKIVSQVLDGVKTLIGPASAELGEWGGEKIAFFRWKNRLNTFKKAQKILDDHGIKPSAAGIPPRLSIPLLEAIGDEDDETVQQLWAGLIANAADPNQRQQITRAFIRILRSIDPLEAAVLQWHMPLLAEADTTKNGEPVEAQVLCSAVHVTEAELKISLHHLASLGCFRVTGSSAAAVVFQPPIDPWPYLVFGEVEFRPTELAVALLQACSTELSEAKSKPAQE